MRRVQCIGVREIFNNEFIADLRLMKGIRKWTFVDVWCHPLCPSSPTPKLPAFRISGGGKEVAPG